MDFTDLERTTIGVVLEESNIEGRFVSNPSPVGASLIIDFYNSMVNLTSFSIYIRHTRNFRSFDLFGKFQNNDWQLIDSRVNFPVTRDPTNYSNFFTNYTCQFPNVYNKFKLQTTAPDSSGENRLTLSRIYFFGGFYPNFKECTCQQSIFPPSYNYFLISAIIYL